MLHFWKTLHKGIYIMKSGVCVSVSLLWKMLNSPPVLKLLDSQGYLWLPYDLAEVKKIIGETFKPATLFFQKNTLCHSFRIIVIPSVWLSFLPNHCHFKYLSWQWFGRNDNHTEGWKNWPYLRVIINTYYLLRKCACRVRFDSKQKSDREKTCKGPSI